MYNHWNKNIKPKLNKYFKHIVDRMKTVSDMCELFFKADIKGMVKKLRIPKTEKFKIQNLVNFIYKKKPMDSL